MDAPPAAAQPYRVLQMKHLVIDKIFEYVSRDAGIVKDTADHDGIVRWIVMAKQAARIVRAPSHLRPSQQPMKITIIKFLEDRFQIVGISPRRSDSFPSANL